MSNIAKMEHVVFAAHPEDLKFAAKLAAGLERIGLRVELHDVQTILPGSGTQIHSTLNSAACIVCVWGKNSSNDSRLYEVAHYAIRKDKHVSCTQHLGRNLPASLIDLRHQGPHMVSLSKWASSHANKDERVSELNVLCVQIQKILDCVTLTSLIDAMTKPKQTQQVRGIKAVFDSLATKPFLAINTSIVKSHLDTAKNDSSGKIPDNPEAEQWFEVLRTIWGIDRVPSPYNNLRPKETAVATAALIANTLDQNALIALAKPLEEINKDQDPTFPPAWWPLCSDDSAYAKGRQELTKAKSLIEKINISEETKSILDDRSNQWVNYTYPNNRLASADSSRVGVELYEEKKPRIDEFIIAMKKDDWEKLEEKLFASDQKSIPVLSFLVSPKRIDGSKGFGFPFRGFRSIVRRHSGLLIFLGMAALLAGLVRYTHDHTKNKTIQELQVHEAKALEAKNKAKAELDQNTPSIKSVSEIAHGGKRYKAIFVTNEGSALIATMGEPELDVWDGIDSETPSTLELTLKKTLAVNLVGDTQFFLQATNGGFIDIWDVVGDKKHIARCAKHTDERILKMWEKDQADLHVSAVLGIIESNGIRIYSAEVPIGGDKPALFGYSFDARTSECSRDNDIADMSTAPHHIFGNTHGLGVITQDAHLRFLDRETGEQSDAKLKNITVNTLSKVALSPRGTFIVMLSSSGKIQVFDRQSDLNVSNVGWISHQDDIVSFDISKDGRWIVGGTSSGDVVFWPSDSSNVRGVPLSVIGLGEKGHIRPVNSFSSSTCCSIMDVKFLEHKSKDTYHIATLGDDSRIMKWEAYLPTPN